MKRRTSFLIAAIAATLWLTPSTEAHAQFGRLIDTVKNTVKREAKHEAEKQVKKQANNALTDINYKKLSEEGKWCIEQLRHPEALPPVPACMEKQVGNLDYISALGTAKPADVTALRQMIDARHASNQKIIAARGTIQGDFSKYCTDDAAVSAVYNEITTEETNLKTFYKMVTDNVSYITEMVGVTPDGKGGYTILDGALVRIADAPDVTARKVGGKASFTAGNELDYADPSEAAVAKEIVQTLRNTAILMDTQDPAKRELPYLKAHAAALLIDEALTTNDPKNQRPDVVEVTEQKESSSAVGSSSKNNSSKSSSANQSSAKKKVKEYQIRKGGEKGFVTEDGIVYDWAHRKLGSLPKGNGDIKDDRGRTIGRIWGGDIKNSSGNMVCHVTDGGSISVPGSNATVAEVKPYVGTVERKGGKSLGSVPGVKPVWAAAIIFCNFFDF